MLPLGSEVLTHEGQCKRDLFLCEVKIEETEPSVVQDLKSNGHGLSLFNNSLRTKRNKPVGFISIFISNVTKIGDNNHICVPRCEENPGGNSPIGSAEVGGRGLR